MTQIIAYRSLSAPQGKVLKNPPEWTKKYPDAQYVTLAPDLMRIALWTQISRHVSAVMLHGHNCLYEYVPKFHWETYICTNTETRDAVKEVLAGVVGKLGPVLKRVPERPAEVAVLESFASAIFAERGTYGSSGWGFDAVLMLLWANLSPKIIYEETILRDGFGKLKVLVMPHCDVLPKGVYEAVCRFQEKGGLIVGDEFLVLGITPDIHVDSIRRDRDKPQETKAARTASGCRIRKELSPYYTPYAAASNPDLVTHVRSSGNADYLFVINDKRTFGDYFGPYGMIAEKGVPNQGTVTVNREAGAVYDLVQSKKVEFRSQNGKTEIPVDFKGSGGKLFLLLPEAIGRVALVMPETAVAGKAFRINAGIFDKKGKTVNTIHPIAVKIRNPDGILTDDSTSAALENGAYTQSISIPLNEKNGFWSVTVEDLASGLLTEKRIEIH